MDDNDKVNLIKDAATILTLDADALRSTAAIALCVQSIAAQLPPDEFLKMQGEFEILFMALMTTQKKIQKAGTAHSLFIEELKSQFGIGGGKPKNVRKGIVRKKS